MITIEEKREIFRRWWKGYIKNYPKEFILEHLDGIAEVIFNSVLNCDIKIFDIDPWHYPSKGDYPEKGVEVWDGYEIVYYLPDLKRWCRYYTDYQIETPLVWMPLPDLPQDIT